MLQASLVLVVVVVEQVLATLDASWAGERGIREAVPRLEEDPERDSKTSQQRESRSAKEKADLSPPRRHSPDPDDRDARKRKKTRDRSWRQ